MVAYLTLKAFHPILNFFVACLYFCGIGFLGNIFLSFIHATTTKTVEKVFVAYPAGVLIVSYIIQLLLFLRIYENNLAKTLCYILLLCGGIDCCWKARSVLGTVTRSRSINIGIALLGLFLILGLIVSLCPSSKIDELYYHMLLPSRIVQDNSLVFYNYPIQGAILPHMFFQIAMVPVFAIGLPHAANTVGYLFGVALVVCIYKNLLANFPVSLSGVLTLALVIGLHPLIWHVTMGGHAYAEFSGMLLMLLLADLNDYNAPNRGYLLLVSLLAIALVSAKISYAPVAVISILYVWSKAINLPYKSFYLLIPWFIFYLPVLLFTFVHSGSPYGPLLAGKFGWSSYDLGSLQTAMAHFIFSGIIPDMPLREVASTVANYSVILLFSFFGIALCWRRNAHSRPVFFILFVQLILTHLFLPHDLRFVGGLLYACAILVFSSVVSELLQYRIWLSRILIAIIGGYSIICGYYATQFLIPWITDTGWKNFFMEKVAYCADLSALDAILPGNAVLLTYITNAPFSYFPREIMEFRSPKDLLQVRGNSSLYLLSDQPLSGVLCGLKIENEVYRNERAVVSTYRDPRRENIIGSLYVYRVIMEKPQADFR